ncbi:MAG: thioether cross-link-forming SCIFF peptide maturase [Desulfitobacteriaceae bacterium]|nr:thioether cross-link-forming SCIFF peptide maturase [Desulfitobacteriaceae bacterium]
MTVNYDQIYPIEDTHKFQIDETKILLDVNSGSVHVIDEVVWDIHEAMLNNGGHLEDAINSLKDRYDSQKLLSARNEILNLIEQETLFTYDEYRDRYIPPEKPVLKSLCLNVSHDCNLRCKYCFASSGDFGGQRLLMPEETGKRAIDFLMEHSGSRKHCEIDFFGGEPLMNIHVVKSLVAYGRKQAEERGKALKFTITTNGVGLNKEIKDYLARENISVVLSLDGRREIHDRVRKFPSGRGSYDVVNTNIKALLKLRNNDNYYIRGTYTGYNKDFYQDAVHMVNEGYKIISLEPVVALEGEDYRLREEDIPQLREEYLKLAQFYQRRKREGRPFTFFHFNLDLNHGPCLPKRLTGCGAGHEYMVVTPEGDLYPCHQFVGREDYKLGNLDSIELNEKLRKHFQNAHIYNKPQCCKCWARFFCSGGCHANAEAENHDIYQPYQLGCKLQKIRLECAIWLQVKEALDEQCPAPTYAI